MNILYVEFLVIFIHPFWAEKFISFSYIMNTLLSKQSPKGVHEKTKRSPENNYQYCNRYSTDLKRIKIETDENIPWNSKVHSNVVAQAATSGVIELNDSRFEHGKSKHGNEAKSSKLTDGSESQLMPRTSSHSIAENRRGVSFSRETLDGLERYDLPAAKSQSVRSLEISDRHGFSLSGRKMGKDDSSEATARDQNKLKPVNRDETCKAALRKTSPECLWKSAVSREPDFSSPKRQKCRSGRVMAKNQGKTFPEPAEAEQEIKISASMTESRVSNANLALDDVGFPQSANSFAILSHEDQQVSRVKVQNLLKEFKEIFTELLKERKKNPIGERQGTFRADLKAAAMLKKDGKWINCKHSVGPVPGINVGDRFQYRTELAIVGLHREFMCGIHYDKHDGKNYATSIVDSGRFYHNQTITADEFIYMGEGGNPELSSKLKDQKLDGGNLALKNSMDSKIPVRVIRGSPDLRGSNTMGKRGFTFLYDGLFQVTNLKYCRDPQAGNKVYLFTMKRTTDCPNLTQQTSSSSGVIDDDDTKALCSSVKNVNNKTSIFLYKATAQRYNGGNRNSSYSSGIWNEDVGFDYEAGAAMAKPISSNRRAYASHPKTKLKLS